MFDLSSTLPPLASRYELRREIGCGSMACVYLADDLATRSPVAVKVLHPELAASTSAARFRREIQLLTDLRHSSLLPVLDWGEEFGMQFFVMPYIDGETLTARLARIGQLSLHELIDITRPIAAGVDYAHERGIIHRDIKPGNILLDGNRVLLCDFGIARAVVPSPSQAVSSSGLVIGTFEYMSPEQAGGDSQVDGRADVYALGCVAFEMLTGEVPFAGSTSQIVMRRHLTELPRSIRSVRSDVPDHVERAVHAALAKDPRDRPPTASAFVDLLDVPGA